MNVQSSFVSPQISPILAEIICIKKNNKVINIEKEDCNFNSKLINDNDNFQYYITLSSVKNIQCNFTKMELI